MVQTLNGVGEMNGSRPFSWDALDLVSLGWGLVDVTVAAVSTHVLAWLSQWDFGDSTPLVLLSATLLAKAVRRLIRDNRPKG